MTLQSGHNTLESVSIALSAVGRRHRDRIGSGRVRSAITPIRVDRLMRRPDGIGTVRMEGAICIKSR